MGLRHPEFKAQPLPGNRAPGCPPWGLRSSWKPHGGCCSPHDPKQREVQGEELRLTLASERIKKRFSRVKRNECRPIGYFHTQSSRFSSHSNKPFKKCMRFFCFSGYLFGSPGQTHKTHLLLVGESWGGGIICTVQANKLHGVNMSVADAPRRSSALSVKGGWSWGGNCSLASFLLPLFPSLPFLEWLATWCQELGTQR